MSSFLVSKYYGKCVNETLLGRRGGLDELQRIDLVEGVLLEGRGFRALLQGVVVRHVDVVRVGIRTPPEDESHVVVGHGPLVRREVLGREHLVVRVALKICTCDALVMRAEKSAVHLLIVFVDHGGEWRFQRQERRFE